MFMTFSDKVVISLCACIAFLVIDPSAARAADSKRVALVIGNSAYTKIGDLRNPHNDAKAFAAVLAKVEPKFKVLTGYDVNAAEFSRRIDEFEKELQGAEVGLFYFAGHSVQIGSASGGENYLLGIDTAPDDVRGKDLTGGDAEGSLKAARLSAVMSRMERLARIRLVFLDACRDNPLVQASAQVAQGAPAQQQLASAEPAVAAGVNPQLSRSAGRGLARAGLASVKGGGGNGGAYIAFATSPGEVALDGDGANSPFTGALVKHIATRGVDIDQAMMLVRRDVKKETSRMNSGQPQVPWSNTSLSDKFYFWPQVARVETAPAAKPAVTGTAPARRSEPAPQPAQREQRPSSDWASPSPSLGGGVGAGGF